MKNEYEIRGDVTAIFLRRKDGSILETLIETSDLERIMQFPNTFYPVWGKEVRSFYVNGELYIRKDGKKTIRDRVSLHRWIYRVIENDLVVDHINNDTLDNRRSNLRITTTSLNAQNRKGPNINNKSGHRGVSWHKASNKWRAFLRVDYKQIQLGLFDDLEDAVNCVKEARSKLMKNSKEASA